MPGALRGVEVGQRGEESIDLGERVRRLGEGALLEVIKDGVGYRGALHQMPQRRFAHTVADALASAAARS